MCDTLIKAKILKTWYSINCPKSPRREDQFIHLSRIKKFSEGLRGDHYNQSTCRGVSRNCMIPAQ